MRVIVTTIDAVLDWARTRIEPKAQGATPAVLDLMLTAHAKDWFSHLRLVEILLRLVTDS